MNPQIHFLLSYEGQLHKDHPAYLNRFQMREGDMYWAVVLIRDDVRYNAANWPTDYPGPSTGGPSFSIVNARNGHSESVEAASIDPAGHAFAFHRWDYFDPAKPIACMMDNFENNQACYCDTQRLNQTRRALWKSMAVETCNPSAHLVRWIAYVEEIMKRNSLTYRTPLSNPLLPKFLRSFETATYHSEFDF